MTGKRLFAVDLGASGGKCFVGCFDAGGFRMEEIHRFSHEGVSFFLADRTGAVSERTYWDDTYIYQQIIKGLQAYRRGFDAPLDGIGIDTWGADGAVITADGEALGKIHCYRDHRLDVMVDEIKTCLDPQRIYAITGIHFQPFNLSNQLRWFATRRKDLLKAGARYLPIPTLFYYYLGGCTQVDSSWASITQLMDARKRRWSRELLKAFGIPARLMPAIVAPGEKIGRLQPRLAASIGLNEADLIAVGSHDTASAFAAAPVRDTRTALIISSGTWSLVGRLVRKPITTPAAMAANISNEGGIGNTRFLKNCMGTWIVQELLRVWEIADGRRMEWSEVERLAAAATAFTAFLDPDHAGFYNPANMESAIREFLAATGQPSPIDRGAILRMVYESLALKYRLVNAQICEICGTPTKVVHVVGGGSSSVLLNQFTADALGVPVLAGPKEATAVGNLMVQAMGAGIIPDMAAAQPIIRQAFPIREFLPGDTAAWNAAYERFRRIQDAVSPRR
jgi:sugar (pentulose or hexulose) kinase